MSQSMGLKAKAKEFLRSKGIKTIRVGSKEVRLQNAKTNDLIKEAAKLGF